MKQTRSLLYQLNIAKGQTASKIVPSSRRCTSRFDFEFRKFLRFFGRTKKPDVEMRFSFAVVDVGELPARSQVAVMITLLSIYSRGLLL